MSCTPGAVEGLLRGSIGPERRSHCRAVGRLAGALCRRFDLDPTMGKVAGLAHDLARDLPAPALLALAAADGRGISSEERARPVLLHGRAGAVLLSRELGECDGGVLEAVADHVTGRPGMSALARVVYAADFLAAGRGFVDRATRRRILARDLNGMVLAVLERVLGHLREAGIPVAKDALALYDELGEQADAQAKVG